MYILLNFIYGLHIKYVHLSFGVNRRRQRKIVLYFIY